MRLYLIWILATTLVDISSRSSDHIFLVYLRKNMSVSSTPIREYRYSAAFLGDLIGIATFANSLPTSSAVSQSVPKTILTVLRLMGRGAWFPFGNNARTRCV